MLRSSNRSDSHTGTLMLCPRLRPPKPISFHRISDHENIKLHINLADSDRCYDDYSKSSSSLGIAIDSMTRPRVNPMDENTAGNGNSNAHSNIISLFDGDITIPLFGNSTKPTTELSRVLASAAEGSEQLAITAIKTSRIFVEDGMHDFGSIGTLKRNPLVSTNVSIGSSAHEVANLQRLKAKEALRPASSSNINNSKTLGAQMSLEKMLEVKKPDKPKATKSTKAVPMDSSSSSSSSAKKPSADKSTNDSSSRTFQLSMPVFSMDDFRGVGAFCRNVGSSRTGFDTFTEKIKVSSEVVVSLIWNDLTSNHVTTTVKFCTPSVPCNVWHCSCDRHIRVEHAYRPLIGMTALFADDPTIAYFIPLSQCAGSGDADLFDSRAFSLPLNCSISLAERWQLVQTILQSDHCLKVVYNCPIFMLPIMHYLQLAETVKQLYDPRIAQFILQSAISEADLELKPFLGAYNIQSSLSAELASPAELGRVSKKIRILVDEMSMLYRVFNMTRERLLKTQMLQVFQESEMPISLLLTHMELYGVCVSASAMQELRALVTEKIDQVTKSAHRAAKSTFNLGSAAQVADVLYTQLKLPPPGGGANSSNKRHHSTSEEDLLRIRDQRPDVIDAILAYRKLSKVMSNNIDGLSSFLLTHRSDFLSYTSNSSKRVHAIWNQTVVRTGRLSCCKPNLQNIPNTIEDVAGININVRSLFTASPGHILIAADYSQIEIRVMSQISEDVELKRLLVEGGDIYKQLASAIFRKPVAMVEESERGRAKTVCLGVMYGMGTTSTAARLGIDVNEAKGIISAFFDRFKQLHGWMEQVKA
jgi:DNA polymerase I-like protein with 3'-5' exonuclease and polymerase domains